MSIIKPTVGRKVWYWASEFDQQGPGAMQIARDQPLDATILAVWGDKMVSVLVLDIYGKPFPKTSIKLLQPGDEAPMNKHGASLGGYCEWMPYQVATAPKPDPEAAIDTQDAA